MIPAGVGGPVSLTFTVSLDVENTLESFYLLTINLSKSR